MNWTFSGSVWTRFGGKSLSKVMAATWQEPLMKGGYSGRYQIFSEGPEDGDEDWILKDNKRRRRSTGGTFNKSSKESQNMPQNISTYEFKAMSTDEKLVKLFQLMTTTNAMNALA